jgi:hypothetical protein
LNLQLIFAVAIGGAIDSVARYLVAIGSATARFHLHRSEILNGALNSRPIAALGLEAHVGVDEATRAWLSTLPKIWQAGPATDRRARAFANR